MNLKMNRCLNDCGVSLTVWILQVCSIVINTVGRINTCAVDSSTRIGLHCKYFISLFGKNC